MLQESIDGVTWVTSGSWTITSNSSIPSFSPGLVSTVLELMDADERMRLFVESLRKCGFTDIAARLELMWSEHKSDDEGTAERGIALIMEG